VRARSRHWLIHEPAAACQFRAPRQRAQQVPGMSPKSGLGASRHPVVLAIGDSQRDLSAMLEWAGQSNLATARSFADAARALDALKSGGAADITVLDCTQQGVGAPAVMRAIGSLRGHAGPAAVLGPATSWQGIVIPGQEAVPASADALRAAACYHARMPCDAAAMRAITQLAMMAPAAAWQDGGCVAAAHLAGVAFSFRTLVEVPHIAAFLSGFYPDPKSASLGIRELMLNAVEHGNLGISYSDKTALMQRDEWEQEVQRRLALPQQQGVYATVAMRRASSTLILRVEDRGAGFDWSCFMEFDTARVRHPHGRGIAMARRVSFDDMVFLPPGNAIICTKHI
jgi:hypothetical protein